MRALITFVAIALTACGGGIDAPAECRVYRGAWVSAYPADIPLTGPEHAGLTDNELHSVGVIHARQQGLDPARVEVGDWADCPDE